MRRSDLVPALSLFVAVLVLGVHPAGAPREAPATDPELRALVDRYWAAWGTGDPASAAPLYAKDPDLVFYDLEPLKFVGWEAYRAGVVPNILSKFANIRFKVNDDFDGQRRGDTAWTSVTVQADGVLKMSGPIQVTIRHTAIWERRGSDWLIVHEHVSVPSALPAPSGK